MKLLLPGLQDTMWSVVGSSTISYVFVRNGAGWLACVPSIPTPVTAGIPPYCYHWDQESTRMYR